MPLLIRQAAPGDARRIAEIHVAGWRAAYRGQMPDALLDSLSVEERASRWREAIEAPPNPGVRTFVIEQDGVITGFASTGPDRGPDPGADLAELYAIYLDPSSWGSGQGRALLAAALDDLRDRGFGA